MSSWSVQRWSRSVSEDKDTEGYPAFEPTGTDATSREEFYRISEGSGEVSMKRVMKVDTLLRGYMSGSMKRGMSMQARASAAWWQANGDLEHRHTQGIYVKEFKTKAPVLYVYIDTSALLQDFTTNKELYLARLANRGFAASDIKFQLSRKGRKKPLSPQGTRRQAKPVKPASSLAPLDEGTSAAIDAGCAELPDGLKGAAAQALKLMLERSRSEQSGQAHEA